MRLNVSVEDFEFIKAVRTTNGYNTDEHELIMLPDNGYLLIGRRETEVDMSQLANGSYFLMVKEGQQNIKTFKIQKLN